MSFSMEEALRIATASLASRKSVARTSYTLYYGNSNTRYEGKMTGTTVKFLIEEFKANGGAWRFAFITPTDEPKKIMRFFDRARSKKFFSLTRGKKQDKK